MLFFVFSLMLFFLASGNFKKKKKQKKQRGGGGGLRLTNGCWVVLSIGTYWDQGEAESHLWLSTHYHDDSTAYHLDEHAGTTEKIVTTAWVCINHLVQCNRLIFSVTLHIFLMFTRWFNMQHMESRRACALVNAATPCKILSAYHSLLRHGIHEFCIET